jgi:hypothetical protein
MTTTEQQPTAVPIQHRRKSRAVPVTVGAVLATIGSVVALAGGGVLAAAGDDGTIGSGGQHEVSTTTSALVSSTATIEDTRDVASALGQPRIGIQATSRDGRDVFVGVARTADVDRYVGGAQIDRVTNIDGPPFKVEKHSEGKASDTLKPPASQDFWVAQSSGKRADLDWKVKDGDYRVVVMHADGSRGVTVGSHFEVGIPYLSTLGLTGMLIGIVMLGGGIVLIARGASRAGDNGRGAETFTVVQPPAPAA